MQTSSRFSATLDPELVASASKGDRDAFGALVSRHQSAVCGVAYAVCGDFSASEDIAQEAFVASWKQLVTLREPNRFRAWVCGIARQLALSQLRKRMARGDRVPGDTAKDEAISAEASPMEQAVSDEEKILLWKALDRLPENYREPLVLFYREQQSVAAVAEAMEISEDTVKQRLSRGRTLLREEVAFMLEGVLGRTRPGAVFTLNVLSALPPILGAAGVAVTAGTAKAAGSGGASAATTGAWAISGVAIASLISSAVGALGLYVVYRVWRSSRMSPAGRMVLVRLGIVSGGLSVALGAVVAWVAMTRGQDLISLGISPAPFLAALISSFVASLTAATIVSTRRLVRIHKEEMAVLKSRGETLTTWAWKGRRYRSRLQFAGLPLLCIAYGPDTASGENRGSARGWIAFGDVALGGFAAAGSIAVAPIAIGGAATGFVALGGAALGVLSFGGLALGWIACGGLAVALKLGMGGVAVASDIAMGGLAVANNWALGGVAFAQHTNDTATLAAVQTHPIMALALRCGPYAGLLSLIAVPSLLIILRQLRRGKAGDKSNLAPSAKP